MSRPKRDYAAEDAQVRGAWYASAGGERAAIEEPDVMRRAGCPRKVAARVVHLRTKGSVHVIALWLTGVVSLRVLEDVVTCDPYDEAAQVRWMGERSRIARERLARALDALETLTRTS